LYNPNNNSNAYELTLPKTKKSKRTIQIADSLLVELIKYKAHVEKEFKKQASTNFVFFKDNYKPLTNTFVRNRLKAILGDEKKDKEEKRYGFAFIPPYLCVVAYRIRYVSYGCR
jgi:site-specific recombinase XerD